MQKPRFIARNEQKENLGIASHSTNIWKRRSIEKGFVMRWKDMEWRRGRVELPVQKTPRLGYATGLAGF